MPARERLFITMQVNNRCLLTFRASWYVEYQGKPVGSFSGAITERLEFWGSGPFKPRHFWALEIVNGEDSVLRSGKVWTKRFCSDGSLLETHVSSWPVAVIWQVRSSRSYALADWCTCSILYLYPSWNIVFRRRGWCWARSGLQFGDRCDDWCDSTCVAVACPPPSRQKSYYQGVYSSEAADGWA